MRIKGWALKPKRAQRVWKDVESVRFSSMGRPLLKVEVATPAQAEKILKDHFSKKEIEEFLKANVVSISSGTTLAKTEEDYAERDLESLFGEL